MVVAESCVRGKVKQHDAAGSQDLRKDAPAPLAIPESGERHRDSECNTDRHAAQLADPAIVEGILQKERGGKQDQQHGDPADPATADYRFEVKCVVCGRRISCRRRFTRDWRWLGRDQRWRCYRLARRRLGSRLSYRLGNYWATGESGFELREPPSRV